MFFDKLIMNFNLCDRHRRNISRLIKERQPTSHSYFINHTYILMWDIYDYLKV